MMLRSWSCGLAEDAAQLTRPRQVGAEESPPIAAAALLPPKGSPLCAGNSVLLGIAGLGSDLPLFVR